MKSKKEIGNLGEDIALNYLKNLGYELLERNGAVLIDDTNYSREISFVEDIFI